VRVDDRAFPAALAEVYDVEFEFYEDGGGVDYEPFEEFNSAEDTTDWFRAWTGNPDVTGDAFRVFGQDGTGGYAAFWLVREGQPLTEQPVVFLGSEGDTGVVARNLADFLWLLAGGVGPLEAVDEYVNDGVTPEPNEEMTEIAERHAPDARKSAADVVAAARKEFTDFTATIDALCR
jgi:hypothetical protein